MSMKRNLILASICLLCALFLYGCGGTATPVQSAAPVETTEPVESSAPVETPAPEAEPVPSASLPDAALVPDTSETNNTDTSLYELAKEYVDKPLSELQELIGEPVSAEYVSSCLIPGGEDGELRYDGFIVSTVKSGDSETVLDVRPD